MRKKYTLSKYQKGLRAQRLKRARVFRKLLKQGKTLEQIGAMHGGITKEAVRKVMRP